MNVSEPNVSQFMSANRWFLIPCYQRPYSWDKKQCRDLFEDMVRLYRLRREHDPMATHFIGSVVIQRLPEVPSSIMVIDGQQRLTTMYLFYLALYRVALTQANSQGGGKASGDLTLAGDMIDYADLAKTIEIEILFEKKSSFSFGASSKHRFTLTESDQEALDKLFAGNEAEFVTDSLLTRNYRLFVDWISAQENMPLDAFYRITESVVFIAIELEAKDDAQLIFESLNSKGLKLSDGDKVRNFLLMGFNSEEVKRHYRELWRPIELNCGDALSGFIKYFLDIKRGREQSNSSLYMELKDYVQGLQRSRAPAVQNQVTVAVLDELLAYSVLFKQMRDCSYKLSAQHDTELSFGERSQLQKALTKSLFNLQQLPYNVRTPVVMQLMMLHVKNQISGTELLEAMKLLETFLFRRWACGWQSRDLNRKFQSIASKLVPDVNGGCDVMPLLKRSLCSADEGKCASSMPQDAEFVQALQHRALYKKSNSKNSAPLKYMLERLENADSLETIPIDSTYSIEHIMPQTLTAEWRAELGVNAVSIHKEWLHRLGNLTLTAYNSKYSNSSFAQKCTMEHGFAHSSLRLNRDIAEHDHWGRQEMEQRTAVLVAKALKLWPYLGDSVEKCAEHVSTPDPGPASVHVPVSAPTPVPEVKDEPESFDYCLAEGDLDLTGTKLRGYEFMGQHYDASNWVQLQRDLIPLIYQLNPERLRSWHQTPWGRFNVLELFIKSSRLDFPIAQKRPNSVFEIDKQIFFCTHQNVLTKVNILQQLFELMQIDPAQLTLRLVRSKGQE